MPTACRCGNPFIWCPSCAAKRHWCSCGRYLYCDGDYEDGWDSDAQEPIEYESPTQCRVCEACITTPSTTPDSGPTIDWESASFFCGPKADEDAGGPTTQEPGAGGTSGLGEMSLGCEGPPAPSGPPLALALDATPAAPKQLQTGENGAGAGPSTWWEVGGC